MRCEQFEVPGILEKRPGSELTQIIPLNQKANPLQKCQRESGAADND